MATEVYCRALRELGFQVTEKLCGIDTAFCGSYGSGRPVIGILGEYDALLGFEASGPAVRNLSLWCPEAAATAAATICWGPVLWRRPRR
ncbi:MAG: hypothetical protein V8T45_05335 [Oscillospiraceae bacterium]